MFFDKRKRFNGAVAVLLKRFGLEVESAPFAVLTVLDHAWLNRMNEHEAALLVGYSHASALYKQRDVDADKFVFTRLYPVQLEWLQERRVRAAVIEPLTASLKTRAYGSYGIKDPPATDGAQRDVNADAPPAPPRASRPAPTAATPKAWIYNRSNSTLTHRASGRTFRRDSHRRDEHGYVIHDKALPWAADDEIEIIGRD